MTTTTELRAALRDLADLAPTVDDLDRSAWAEAGAADRTRRARPSGRSALAVLAAAAAVVALVAIAVKVGDGRTNNSSPPAARRAVLEVRPLVAPAVPTTSTDTARSADPLRALPFTAPASESDYDALSATRQHQLLAALATTDCDAQSASAAPTRVACSPDLDGRRVAYLLGPSIFGNAQLTDARAVPPSLPGGSTEWTVALTLNDSATEAWTSYTTDHHVDRPTADSPTQCASAGTPCSDYVAFVIDGSAQSVPLTLAALGRSTQISGNFTERTATRLAQKLGP